ncbi:exocyst subunit exo70 family protein H1 [Forsythia ovata]|uniref:Exocyst subunit Exo70 family protein n=1 Tax=Forsythia ovata TaxID=205694 RepID=A0ABD1WHL3_9LAMI
MEVLTCSDSLNSVVKSKRWPDKVFQLMNLYEAISDIWPEIESIFSYESLSAVKLQAFSSLHKLGDSIQTILSEFESSIQKNSSRTPVPRGAIHPLTNSVMNYVSLLANYSGVLSDIVSDSGTPPHSPFPESYFHSPSPDEAPTSALSASTGLDHSVEKVRTTTLKFLLGDDWLSKLDRKVKLYAANYETVAWNKVFSCLPENLPEEMSPDTIKGHFRQFNSAFDEAYRRQGFLGGSGSKA